MRLDEATASRLAAAIAARKAGTTETRGANPNISVKTLRAAYQVLSDEWIARDLLKWDSVRIGSVFALGILAVAGGLLTRTGAPKAGYFDAGVVLIVTSAVLWWWVRTNVVRESALQYATEFSRRRRRPSELCSG